MKQWIAIVAALLIETQAHAQSDANSGRVYLPSCLAAAEIVQGKHPATDSEDAAKQLKQAAICFGAVTAIMNLEPFFKPEFAVCPPGRQQSIVSSDGPGHYDPPQKPSGPASQQFPSTRGRRPSYHLALF